MSGRTQLWAAAGTLAILYAAARLVRRERVDGGWLIERKDGMDVPADIAATYENIMRGVRSRFEDRGYTVAIVNPTPLGTFEQRRREAYMAQKDKKYPYRDGPMLVLGPEIFTEVGKQVICWQGRNYIPQPESKIRESLQYQAATKLVEHQLVLSNAQKATLGVLDEMASCKLISVESAESALSLRAAKSQRSHDSVLTLQDEGGSSPMFTCGPDGSMRAMDDDFDDELDEED